MDLAFGGGRLCIVTSTVLAHNVRLSLFVVAFDVCSHSVSSVMGAHRAHKYMYIALEHVPVRSTHHHHRYIARIDVVFGALMDNITFYECNYRTIHITYCHPFWFFGGLWSSVCLYVAWQNDEWSVWWWHTRPQRHIPVNYDRFNNSFDIVLFIYKLLWRSNQQCNILHKFFFSVLTKVVHPSVSFQRFSDKRNDLKSTNKLNIDTSKFDDDVSQLSQ